MKKVCFFLLTLFFCLLSVGQAVAQSVARGVVVDASTQEPLIGVSILVKGTTTGDVTDLDGRFNIKLPEGHDVLVLSYVGYETVELKAAKAERVAMEPVVTALKDVVVTSSVAIQRKTPIAVSSIEPAMIEEKLGNMEFPELLKSTPGVYVTRDGGGYGDSKINMRGFQSANVAVMINGVPVNDMEWGGVYWSNWAGLSDVTRVMQTQRGLGASKVSSPSVGGSINIITKSTDAKRGGSVSYGIGNDGYNKLTFNVSSGLTKRGWAFTVLGSRTWGKGYIQGTEFEGWNYFVNISKMFGERHSLSLTAFGAPQWHNQRSSYDGLTIEGWQQVQNYMGDKSCYLYNATYGFDKNGQRRTSAYNSYHKPQISLNYNWDIDENSSWSTSLYTSIGRGYGYSGQGTTSTYANSWYGASNGTLNTTFRKEDGTFAYDEIQELNEQSESGSLMVMSKSKNYHNWYGLLSTYTRKFKDIIDFYAGVDVRYYKGIHTNEIIDLYNGDYYIDRYRANVKVGNNAAAADPTFAQKKLQVGDVVYRDYDGHVMQEGVFGQVEANLNQVNAFVSASVSNTAYWRYDRFYYDEEHARSKTVNFWGFTVKGGLNYNFAAHHNVFANVGYISRAPFFSGGAFLQSTVSNEINQDAVNEKIFSVEAGYGWHTRYIKADLNLYYTKWMDKTMTRSSDFSYTDAEGNIVDDRYVLNMQGVDARHMGVELDIKSNPTKWMELSGMLSIGDWRWNSNATGYFYNSAGQPLADNKGTIASGIQAEDHASMTLNLKGVHVGGSAQTTFALGVAFKPLKGLRLGADFNYFCRNYADWSFSSSDLVMGGVKDYPESWKIPGAGVLDVQASYRFDIGKCSAVISGNVNNILNQMYIADAYNGGGNDWQTAYRVFYGYGRTWTARLKVNF